MFFKLSIFVALSSALAASALTLHAPTSGWVVGGHEVVAWKASSSDPSSFDLVLSNGVDSYTIASDLTTGPVGAYTFTVPSDAVTGSGYTLEATDVGDASTIIAHTSSFTISS